MQGRQLLAVLNRFNMVAKWSKALTQMRIARRVSRHGVTIVTCTA